MRNHDDYHPMTFFKACHALYLVKIKRLSQTKAAILLDVNVGSISHVVNGHRYPEAFPISPEGSDSPEGSKH